MQIYLIISGKLDMDKSITFYYDRLTSAQTIILKEFKTDLLQLYILWCPCIYAVLMADELVDSNAPFSIVSRIWMVLISQGFYCVEAAAFTLSFKLCLKACIHWIDASNASKLFEHHEFLFCLFTRKLYFCHQWKFKARKGSSS